MSTIKALYAAATTITVTLSSMTNGSARRSAAVDNSTNLYTDALLSVIVKTGASGTSATGTWSVYLYASADDASNYTAGGSTDAAYTMKGDEIYLGTMSAIANATTYVGFFTIAIVTGSMPRNWGLIFVNNGGGTSDTTAGNFVIKYQGYNAQVV